MRLHERFFWIFILFIPTQLTLHFWPDFSYISGIRVDYLSPTLYFTDLIFILVIVFWLYDLLRRAVDAHEGVGGWTLLGLIGVLVLAFLNILSAESKGVAIYRWVRFFEYGMLIFYVSQNKERIKKYIGTPLLMSFIFLFLLAIAQVIRGKSAGGLMYFLGERRFSVSDVGIARGNFRGSEFLRPYATLPHPNALAGYVLVSMVILQKRFVNFLGTTLIVLSYSLNAFIALLIYGAYLLNKKIVSNSRLILLILVLLTLGFMAYSCGLLSSYSFFGRSVYERLVLACSTGHIVKTHFWFGAGAGNFIIAFREVGVLIWILQPVHNLFLLILSEIGMLGLVLFFLLTWRALKGKIDKYKIALMLILITGTMDHYSLTLQQNSILFSVVLGFLL